MKIFKLTSEQQKAFDNLKKAFKNCENKGVFFYNNYGRLGALDRRKVVNYNDIPSKYHDQVNCVNPNEISLPCNEWADDAHYFHLV